MYDICLLELNNEFRQTLLTLKEYVPYYLRVPISLSCKIPKKNKITTDDMEYMSTIIWKNNKVKNYIEEQIYIKDNILEKIKMAMKEKNKDIKEKLVNDIISVGEFNKN